MFFIYNLLAVFSEFILKIMALFNPKIKLLVEGQNTVFGILKSKIKAYDKMIWFHAASLGEYEQGLPLMEKIKSSYPNHLIVLTFFSPSGFEVRKNNGVADVTVYLPFDTKSNVKQFMEIVRPEMVFFIKYEFWPNYLAALKKRETPTYLISGVFREDQAFFKWYGSFYRKGLGAFEHFFVQNSSSKDFLLKLGKSNITVSGDTRFDRVSAILERDTTLDYISEFKNNTLTIVVGSSWPKDENHIIDFINSTTIPLKFIIAPHNIQADQIQELKNSITKKTVLFTENSSTSLAEFDVFIVDVVGILTKVYSYADIAYVGGGFGNPGVHNILEPATFGVPIVIGPNFSHFSEAIALVNMGGCISISDNESLFDAFETLIRNEDIRNEKGHICKTFVAMNKGATALVLNYLNTKKPN